MTPRVPKETIDQAQDDEMRDETAVMLSQLASELAAVANDREARQEKLKDVEKVLSNLKVKDFTDLAESPVVQTFLKLMGNDDLKPGEIRNRGTLAERARDWTYRDMEQFPKVTLEPRETLPVTWNGLTYQFQDGIEITVPEPVANIYKEHRYAVEQAKKHENFMLGYSDVPPDPNWMAETSAAVRAFSQMGPTPDARKRGIGFLPAEAADAQS